MTLSYETAKKLKDAGFPLEENSHKVYFLGQERIELIEYVGALEDTPRIPTLSELIEACGDSFQMLERNANGKNAERIEWETWTPGAEGVRLIADSPEEAVANLWLELNK